MNRKPKSLYDISLRTVLETRGIELFQQLDMLQIKRDPLSGPCSDAWIDSAIRNPSVLDWLVLNTDCTIAQLVELVYSDAMEACCIEVLDWFVEPLSSETEYDHMQSPDEIVYAILSENSDPDDMYHVDNLYYRDYTRARLAFIRKDNVPVAQWMIQHHYMSPCTIRLHSRNWFFGSFRKEPGIITYLNSLPSSSPSSSPSPSPSQSQVQLQVQVQLC
jgi:hypothetical protein